MRIEMTEAEKKFFEAYLDAARFTDTSPDSEFKEGSDFDADFLRESAVDCLSFYSRINCYLSTDAVVDGVRSIDGEWSIEELAGHDFWLTRNGHGTGFWSREDVYGETYSKMFTKIAEGYGEAYPVFDELNG